MDTETRRSDNYDQLKKFLIDTGLIQHGTIINNIEAVVAYKYGGTVKRCTALVSFTMEGVDSCGDITIDSPELSVTKYHTGFNTTFQTYKFDVDSNSLIIRGCSTRMKGNYEIIITPVL